MEPAVHIVIGLIVGSAFGILGGVAAVQYVAPAPIAMQASKVPALTIPQGRYWDI
jgi:hypothetical protein